MTDQIPVNAEAIIRRGVALVVFGFGGFLLWAGLAPLDEGVPLAGTVVVDSQRKPVQHMTGGIVADVMVKDGQRVKEGDVLFSLDVETLHGQRGMVLSQRHALEAQIAGLKQVIPQRATQVASLSRELLQVKPLVDEGLYPRNRYTDSQRQLSQLQGQLASDRAALNQAFAQLAESSERLAVADTELRRAEIRAPADGAVLAPKIPSRGAIVAPGDVIMEIVPDSDRLIIDAQLPPHLVEVVRAELPAQLRFTALDQRKTPVIDGQVDRVGADVVTDRDGNRFYQTRLSASTEQLKRLGAVTLQPGMPVEAIVVTGERSFLNYLLKPLSDHFARGLKER